MKTITKIIALVMLTGAFVGCTIVMPTPNTTNTSKETPSTSNSKESTYTRPTPTTTAGSNSYTRPTPTTTVGNNDAVTYERPKISSTTNVGSSGSASVSKDLGSDGRIDAPKGKNTETKADSTVQARSRVRR